MKSVSFENKLIFEFIGQPVEEHMYRTAAAINDHGPVNPDDEWNGFKLWTKGSAILIFSEKQARVNAHQLNSDAKNKTDYEEKSKPAFTSFMS